MFGSLVESGSHKSDFKRRGAFFAATLAFYAVLICAAGVGSIYAYNARIEDHSEAELLAMIDFRSAAAPEPEKPRVAQATSPDRSQNFARREEISVITPYNKNNEVASPHTREIAPNVPVVKGIDTGFDTLPHTGPVAGPLSPGGPGRDRGGVIVPDDGESAPEVKTPPRREPSTPPDKPREVLKLASSLISSKAISNPVPPYPEIARRVSAQGTVAVQILIDEQGRVISAQATSGHPLLQKPAADAARRARFSPTVLNGQPVRVSGVIYYNFKLQ
jgi:protein TonB